MRKYIKSLEETIHVTSTNCGFRTIDHIVSYKKQTKRGTLLVQDDGIHTRILNIWYLCKFSIHKEYIFTID